MQQRTSAPPPPPKFPSRSLGEVLSASRFVLWSLYGPLRETVLHDGQPIDPDSDEPGDVARRESLTAAKVPWIGEDDVVFLVRTKTSRLDDEFRKRYNWSMSHLAEVIVSYSAYRAAHGNLLAHIAAKINEKAAQIEEERAKEDPDLQQMTLLNKELGDLHGSVPTFEEFTGGMFSPGSAPGSYVLRRDGSAYPICIETAISDLVTFILSGCGRVTHINYQVYAESPDSKEAYQLEPVDPTSLYEDYDLSRFAHTDDGQQAFTQLLRDAGILMDVGEEKKDAPPLATSSGTGGNAGDPRKTQSSNRRKNSKTR